ncbi:MAG: winged helix-turn-helix domain-containing protein [Candidatus Bathyarchaeia archaeon]
MDKETALEALNSLGLTTSAFKILCYLTFNQKEAKPSEISEEMGMKAGTVRARLSELKEAELVKVVSNGYVSNILPYDIIMRIYNELREETKS